MIKKNLIFDLGFHNGDDSDFYLKKGFNVIALEANPELVRRGIKKFRNYKEVLGYVNKNIPKIMTKNMKKSYIKRFFYTQAGFYKAIREYKAQDFLYKLTHVITRGI